MTRYGLILSCSKRKRITDYPMHAIDLYDGYYYRILRKLLREGHGQTLDIQIISAKYGVIGPGDQISWYDTRMTRQLANHMHFETVERLSRWIYQGKYPQVFINLGAEYLHAIEGLEHRVLSSVQLVFAKGGIGNRGSQMKTWILRTEKAVANTTTNLKERHISR